ncbi:unnamed protein product [Caenorhabditis sp. 36 PRJEB53466]|nr:unnamed protein product [Caenorhabditis sp. 36 PRJEB53466]
MPLPVFPIFFSFLFCLKSDSTQCRSESWIFLNFSEISKKFARTESESSRPAPIPLQHLRIPKTRQQRTEGPWMRKRHPFLEERTKLRRHSLLQIEKERRTLVSRAHHNVFNFIE